MLIYFIIGYFSEFFNNERRSGRSITSRSSKIRKKRSGKTKNNPNPRGKLTNINNFQRILDKKKLQDMEDIILL